MSIPPVSGSFPMPLPSPGGPLAVALQNFTAQYHALAMAWTQNPSQENLDRLETCMRQVEQFLEENQTEILSLAKYNGWPIKGDPSSECLSFIQGAVRTIQSFLKHPNHAGIDLTFEQLTQVHWLMTNRRF